MNKKILSLEKGEVSSFEDAFSRMKKVLKDRYACFVLITCTSPEKDGKMEVEMNFEGDEDLAAFLVGNASEVFEARVPRQESK